MFLVSPITSVMRKLSDIEGGVRGDPRFSPDSRYVAVAGRDGAVYQVSVEEHTFGAFKRLTQSSNRTPSNLAISPDSRLIAYNRRVRGILQIFTASAQ